MRSLSAQIEDIILTHSARGMDRVRGALREGYCERAARLIFANRQRVLIGTGFPVGGSFETDGPIGAIGLYRVLEALGGEPVFGCAPPISNVLCRQYRTCEIPILDWDASLPLADRVLGQVRPSAIVSVERPGVAADGRYYNMRGQDISDHLAKFDVFCIRCACPTIGVGDGGNEIGMGNIHPHLSQLSITPSVTACTELVIATVSNWGVYGIIGAMSLELGRDLFRCFDPGLILADLVRFGAVDGKTGHAECTEDGFPLSTGLAIIERLRTLFPAGLGFPAP
jgi:hypothetical protein